MDDDLLEGASPERRSLLPGRGFFVPDAVEEDREEAEIAEALVDANVAIVADRDADGLACVALLREIYDDAVLLGTSPHELATGFEYVAEYGSLETLLVCDLSPDSFEAIEAPLRSILDGSEVRWFDHHRWDEDVAETVREAGVDLVVGDSEEECTADVVVRAVEDDFPRHLVELAAVTRDHDLWINDDPRSADLADYAYWTEPEEYVEVVSEHGPDLPEEALELLAERRIEKEDRIERAVRRAEFREVGDVTVGVTYGRCSQNEVADALREQGADAAVIVKPAGSASIRGSEGFERCHEVAGRVNGGGHPKAAGCKPDVYDDVFDYAHHWTSQGTVAKRVILDAFRAVADGDSGTVDDSE